MDALQKWHAMMHSQDMSRVRDILTEDCVFYSPVVHTPQAGRELTALYLGAAMQVFNDSFVYAKEIVTPQHAVLEFTCTVDGILINGVDIMSFAPDGRIAEFKVMVRPLKAVNILHAHMAAMLEQMKAAPAAS
ncbi:MAG: hypothetical protein ACI87W_002419 [Halieaceae bacterium]|jgi:hypothetical protein